MGTPLLRAQTISFVWGATCEIVLSMPESSTTTEFEKWDGKNYHVLEIRYYNEADIESSGPNSWLLQ